MLNLSLSLGEWNSEEIILLLPKPWGQGLCYGLEESRKGSLKIWWMACLSSIRKALEKHQKSSSEGDLECHQGVTCKSITSPSLPRQDVTIPTVHTLSATFQNYSRMVGQEFPFQKAAELFPCSGVLRKRILCYGVHHLTRNGSQSHWFVIPKSISTASWVAGN